MNLILLSGGSGKRLWPLSNDVRSKQFLRMFKKEDGTYESMVQRMYRGILHADPRARVTFATSSTQIASLKNQLGHDIHISVEPCRRDTFPAIALAGAYLHEQMHIDEEETVVICPVDPYVEDDYFRALKRLNALVETERANLYVMGIEPTYPSEKYGYLLPGEENVRRRKTFAIGEYREKPDVKTAEAYIARGALWNAGVFACRLHYLLEKARQLIGYDTYETIRAHYEQLAPISFDYAVGEKEPRIEALRFHGMWKDLGTWNTLTEAMEEQSIGNVIMDKTNRNTHVINDLDIPVMCMGMKNAVVAASPDGILVSDKNKSSYIKPFVDRLNDPVMYAEKSWGSYQVIDVEEHAMTIKITLHAGCMMNYHAHEHRDEVWTIISGVGTAVLDGQRRNVKAGDVVRMNAGVRHTLIATTALQAIEVQTGETITVEDKIKYDLEQDNR